MTTDLVESLRATAQYEGVVDLRIHSSPLGAVPRLLVEAVDEIERLRAALDLALYSLCSDNYEEQKVVAHRIKTDANHQQNVGADKK